MPADPDRTRRRTGLRHRLSRWLAGRWSPRGAAPPSWVADAEEEPTDAAAPSDGDSADRDACAGSAYACPFCGRGHATPRPRCAACGGLPVVPRDEGRVYDTVVVACGAGTEPAVTASDGR